MDSVDLEVLKSSVKWLDDGHATLLVTITKTWGSSPRPEGAMLAIRADGWVVGSVSGGCIEDDLIDRVRKQDITQTRPEVVTYGISADEARRFGLPCGGTIQLVIEPLGAHSRMAELLQAVTSGRLVARRLLIETGEVTLADAQRADGVVYDEAAKTLTTVHGPRFRLLVIGAGQLSKFLCQMALGLDFQVTVCDPREEYQDTWDVPGVTLVRTMPDDTVAEMRLDERCAVVALTHDPKLDDLALMEALKSKAFYVGALGSRKNNEARRKRLMEHFGMTADELAGLHGPIGLFIGSRTPPEIAVSIAAEIVAAKNGVASQVASVEAGKNAQNKGDASGCAL
jgi:xanthine dehydrogenase accessory factor